MTVVTPPVFLQDGSYPAETVRQMMAGMLGSTTGSFAGVGALDPGHGVTRFGGLAVTQKGTPDMSVDVAGGSAFIRGTLSANQGCYAFHNDGTVNLAVGTADATNARRDLVVAQVRDSAYAGSDDDARLFVVQGTPAGSPADPAVPDNCLVLARVTVPALASSIVTANITDTRTRARPWNSAWGVLAVASVTSGQTFSTTSFVDATGLTATAQFLLGRRYRLRAYVLGLQNSGTGFVAELLITNAANTAVQTARKLVVTNERWSFAPSLDFAAAGNAVVTYKLRGRCDTASRSWKTEASATEVNQFVIEDMGPV